MQIGQVIRKHRKLKNMTQEDMANRLGVTAPAVNKWENGNSLPDITLLAPIARLLNISLDTLLSFREELTTEEIQDIIYKVNAMLKEKTYAEAFAWAKEKLEQYPNCEPLILEVAVILNAYLVKEQGADVEQYENRIVKWLVDVLQSDNEEARTMAADALFAFYLAREQYDKAEEYLEYYSRQNPEKKRKQAVLYSRTDRREEAYKTYEELLFSMYQMANMSFQGIYMLAMQDQNMEKAWAMAEKLSGLAVLFEMGRYHEVCYKLELAVTEKDVEKTITVMKEMLASLDEINGFVCAPLYEHTTFREPGKEFAEQIREELLHSFRDEETFGFLKDDARWQELAKQAENNRKEEA